MNYLIEAWPVIIRGEPRFNAHVKSRANGNILWFTTQGYTRKIDLTTMCRDTMPGAEIVWLKKRK